MSNTQTPEDTEQRAAEIKAAREAELHAVNPTLHTAKYPDYRNKFGELCFLIADDWPDFVGKTVKEFRLSLNVDRRGQDIAKLHILRRRYSSTSIINLCPEVATLCIGRASMPISNMTASIYDDYIISKDIGYLDGRAEYRIEVVPPTNT